MIKGRKLKKINVKEMKRNIVALSTISLVHVLLGVFLLIQTGGTKFLLGALWIAPKEDFNFKVSSHILSEDIWSVLIWLYLFSLVIYLLSFIAEKLFKNWLA